MQWPKLRKLRVEGGTAAAAMPQVDPKIARLARKLDALPEKDEARARKARDWERRQNEAGEALLLICAHLVETLNLLLEQMQVELSPPAFQPESLDTVSGLLIQINANGRIVQVQVKPREECSSDPLRSGYLLTGSLRWFNQELLERQEIQEEPLLCSVDGSGHVWRYLDPRTRKSGVFDQDYLAEKLEQLL